MLSDVLGGEGLVEDMGRKKSGGCQSVVGVRQDVEFFEKGGREKRDAVGQR